MPSSVIKSFAYDSERRALTIEFRHGGLYEYANVPAAVFDDLRAAPSQGTYFWHRIRDQYAFRRLDPPPRLTLSYGGR